MILKKEVAAHNRAYLASRLQQFANFEYARDVIRNVPRYFRGV